MSWTDDQVVEGVLEHLGVKASGVTAAGEDTLRVTTAYTSVYALLAKQRLAPWPIDEVPDEAFIPLTYYLAGRVAAGFGHSGQRLLEFREDARQGYKDLATAAAGFRSRLRVRGSDF